MAGPQPPELPHADPASVGFCPERTRRLVQVFEREVERGRLPGAVLLLGRRGRVVLHEAVGRLAPGGPAMRPDALFRIYSMTKPMVSVAALMLVEQGRLSLADPIAKHLPAFANTPVLLETAEGVQLQPPVRPPTVQDLLRHTSGPTYGEFTRFDSVRTAYAEAGLFSPKVPMQALALTPEQLRKAGILWRRDASRSAAARAFAALLQKA